MPDSVIAVAERIRSNDPRNVPALKMLAESYGTKNDIPKRLQVLSQLAASDPTNIRMIQDVVADMARLGHPELAVPLMRDLLQNNPGDPALLNLAWLVYLNAASTDTAPATRANAYEAAINVGTEMVRVDTAAATADYYSRLAAAYLGINQPQKASEVAALAARKFPGDASIQLFNAQALYKAGQLQQAEDAAKKAVAANPKNAQGYFLLATIQGALNKNDDLTATLQTARSNGADPGSLSQLALKAGSDAYKAGQASKDIADFQRAIRFLQLSDQLQASADAKFLLGASAFSVGQTATISANEKRSCDLAKTARDAFNLASMNLPAGGQKYPTEAAQLMTAIPQFTPAVDNEVKRFCK